MRGEGSCLHPRPAESVEYSETPAHSVQLPPRYNSSREKLFGTYQCDASLRLVGGMEEDESSEERADAAGSVESVQPASPCSHDWITCSAKKTK